MLCQPKGSQEEARERRGVDRLRTATCMVEEEGSMRTERNYTAPRTHCVCVFILLVFEAVAEPARNADVYSVL